MCSRALVAALALAGLALAPQAARPAAAQQDSHAQHDPQKWPDSRKADEFADHARKAREQIDTLRNRKGDDGKPWCPTTAGEWRQTLDTLACFMAMRDLWTPVRKGPLRPEFDGPADSPGGKRRETVKAALKDVKDIREELLERLNNCDKSLAPGKLPDQEIAPGISKRGVEVWLDKALEDKKQWEEARVGLRAFAMLDDCPDCDEDAPAPRIIIPEGKR
jgi:hypothetical protein